MSMSNYPKAYGTVAVAVAFMAGILLTLGFKDFYPDLERRYQRRRGQPLNRADSKPGSKYLAPVQLEDHTKRQSLAAPESLIAEGVEGCIGNTPLFKIKSLSQATGTTILAKAEFLNPGGSPKDRVALSIILHAESLGLLRPHHNDTIYEGTVGSTGISLALLARARGYKCHICMPSDQSTEKSVQLLKLGATVERVTPAPITSTENFVNLARRKAGEHEVLMGDGSKGFFADQFENEANWRAHFEGTGPEIWMQSGGRIDTFVAGAGTGGTLSGTALFLKQAKNMDVRIVLADPTGSSLYNAVKNGVLYSPTEREGTRRRHQVDSIVEGIGINRLTENFQVGREMVDDAVKVTDEQALRMAKWLVEKDGIFIGSSSAVNCVAAVVEALRMAKVGKGEDKVIVTVLCDSGARHLSKFWKKVGELEGDLEGGNGLGNDREALCEFLGIQ